MFLFKAPHYLQACTENLLKHGRCCMQNNQLPMKTFFEWNYNSNTYVIPLFWSPSHNFGPHQVLVKLAQEVGRQGIKPGTRKINGRYIHSHLASRLEGEKLYSHPWSSILEFDLSSLGELCHHFTRSSQNISLTFYFFKSFEFYYYAKRHFVLAQGELR